MIENLGVAPDQYDTLDLSDNEILKLENFPLMKKLRSVLLNNNRISKIANNLGSNLPALQSLMLTNNKIAHLSDLQPLGTFASTLTHLSLLGNPVTRSSKSYRVFLISLLPKLEFLDFSKVKSSERAAAAKFAERIKSGEISISDLFGVEEKGATDSTSSSSSSSSSASTSSSSSSDSSSAQEGIPLTAEHKAKILQLIENATNLAEVEELEQILITRRIPPHMKL